MRSAIAAVDAAFDAAMLMARDRLVGLAVLYALALAAVYMLYAGSVGLLAFTRDVAARAPSVVAYTGDVVVLPAAVVVLLLAAMETFKPGKRAQDRLAMAALLFFAGTIVLPIAFRIAVGAMLPARGYVLCEARPASYTLPATRWGRGAAACTQAPPVAF